MGMGGFGTCQVLMVHGVATSLIPWASQRRLSWCHTSERLSWSTAAWRCWPGSAWWHLTLSAFLVRSFPLRLCQCPLMPTMLSLGLLVSMLKCCSGWALWSCAASRRSLNGTPWRSLVTTASPVCSPVMRRVRRRCAQPSWRTAAWLWWHSQVQWPRLPSPAIRSHGCSEMRRKQRETIGSVAKVATFWWQPSPWFYLRVNLRACAEKLSQKLTVGCWCCSHPCQMWSRKSKQKHGTAFMCFLCISEKSFGGPGPVVMSLCVLSHPYDILDVQRYIHHLE